VSAAAAGRTLVLGANGNVGTLLVERLAREGAAVTGALRPGREAPREPRSAGWAEVELGTPASLAAALAGVNRVVWTPSVGLVPGCIDTLERADLERVVVISSASVHTTLDSGGARAKRDAEARIRASRLRWTILRPTMIYGNARDRNLTRLLEALERWPIFPLFGDGAGLLQPVFIDDLVEAIVRALSSPVAVAKTYDLGGGLPLSYRQLVAETAAALGRHVWLVGVPLPLAAAGVRLANRCGVRALREEQVLRLAEDKVVDNDPVCRELGIAPRVFADGIRRQIDARRAGRAA